MNTKTSIKVLLPSIIFLAVSTAYAADPVQGGTTVSGKITPKLYFFDYFKGFGADRTQFLERYNYQKGSDNRSGAYFDADLSLLVSDSKRDVFVLERRGFGAYNHRGTLKADSDTLGLTGYYSHFRSATGGIGFLYSPNQVTGGTDPSYFPTGSANTNTGYLARFNDDSGQTLFKIDRTTYGAGLALKPALFGTAASAGLNYDGYKRDGNRFATYVLGGGDVVTRVPANPARALQRWRGFDMPVDEKMNRLSLNLGGAPGGFQIAYEGSLEKFNNQAREYEIADFAANVAAAGTTTVTPASLTSPLHFVSDSTLISNNLRLARNFGSTAVAAGYGLSILDQDSFTQNQQDAGYNTGKITTNSAYLNVNSNALNGVGLEGFIKYYNRDNDSTFPAVGLIDPASGDNELGVRINRIKSLNYGLAARFRPTALKSTVTAGWKREDKDRDLSWTAVVVAATAPPRQNGIQPQRSLYREKTLSDELYVNLVSRPMPGLIFRLTPSYVWADQAGLATEEPEKAVSLKARLSYAATNGMLTSGYYNYKNKKNATGTFTDGLAPAGVPRAGVDGAATTQDVNKTQQAAGISLNLPMSEWINTSAGLSWMQDDFTGYYLRSNRRRFEAPNNAIAFIVQDRSNYNIDTYVLTLGGDWQANDALRYSGSYTFSQSKGNTASGLILSELPAVDGSINNSVHTLGLGADYALEKNMKFKASYDYDYYTDKVYSTLTGGYHTLMFGVSVGF